MKISMLPPPSFWWSLPLLSAVVIAQNAEPSPSRGDPPPIFIPVPTSHHASPVHSVFDMGVPVPAPVLAPTLVLDDRQKKKSKKGKVKYHHPQSIIGTVGTPDDDLYLLFPHPITVVPSRKGGKGSVYYIPAPVPVPVPADSPIIPPPVNIPPVALLPATVPSAVAPPPVLIPPVSIPYVDMPAHATTAVPYPKGSSSVAKNSQYKKQQAQVIDGSSAHRHPGYDAGTLYNTAALAQYPLSHAHTHSHNLHRCTDPQARPAAGVRLRNATNAIRKRAKAPTPGKSTMIDPMNTTIPGQQLQQKVVLLLSIV